LFKVGVRAGSGTGKGNKLSALLPYTLFNLIFEIHDYLIFAGLLINIISTE
jgi:hypothetical protein